MWIVCSLNYFSSGLLCKLDTRSYVNLSADLLNFEKTQYLSYKQILFIFMVNTELGFFIKSTSNWTRSLTTHTLKLKVIPASALCTKPHNSLSSLSTVPVSPRLCYKSVTRLTQFNYLTHQLGLNLLSRNWAFTQTLAWLSLLLPVVGYRIRTARVWTRLS